MKQVIEIEMNYILKIRNSFMDRDETNQERLRNMRMKRIERILYSNQKKVILIDFVNVYQEYKKFGEN